jgi:uncharacterized RDD family membrane protein YckC
MISDSIPTSTRFGGFWIRLVALSVDMAILWVVRYPIVLIFWALSDDFSIWGGVERGTNNIGLEVLYVSINLALFFAYFVLMDVRYRATLGKMLLRLEVVDSDMQAMTYKQAALRETIGKALSAVLFLLGFLWVGFDVRKQGWHDKIAETYVIRSSINE